VHLGPRVVLEDWWPTIRGLTLCQEFCRVSHWKKQYGWVIKIYMAYNEEKGKSHEDLWGLGSFILFVSLELRTINRDASNELVKCKSSKSYFQSNLPEKFGHIRSLDRVPEVFAGHVWTSLISSQPGISGPFVGFQRRFSDMSGLRTGHIWSPSSCSNCLFSGLIRPGHRFQRHFWHIQSLEQTCPVNPYFPRGQVFCNTYPSQSLGSSRDLQTYSVPGPNMSGLSNLTQVMSRHQTCPVPRPGSNNVSWIYPISWPDMSGSLTPQQVDSF
jgi:hypothetical protein